MINQQEIKKSDHHSSLLRNVVWMVWSGAISIANSVVLWAVFARWRETAELGRFTVVMSMYLIFFMLCTLGLGSYLTSEIARRPDRRRFIASAATFFLSWSMVCLAAMSAAGFLVSASSEVRVATAILSLAMLPTGLISLAESVFTASGRARVIALATTSENILRTVVPLILIYCGCGLPVICLSFVSVRLVACSIYAWVARRHLAALAQARWSLVSEIATKTPTFAGVTILATLHGQAVVLLAGRLAGEAAAAEFGLASRFLIPLWMLLWSYASVMQPTATRLAAISRTGLGEFLSRSLQWVLAFALPIAVGGTLLAREALGIVYGERYSAAAPVLSLLAWSVVPMGVIMITARGLVATGNQHVDLIGNAAALISNLALSLLLIPRYGVIGGATAQLLSVSVQAALVVGYTTRRFFPVTVWRALGACWWPLALMALVVWQARQWGLWGAATAGGFVYLAGLFLVQRDKRSWEFGVRSSESRVEN